MPKILVLDATPLIHLSKIRFWKNISALGFSLETTPQVIAEISIGRERYWEAAVITALLKSKTLSVKESTGKKIEVPKGLSAADASVVFLAKKLGAIAVLDDSPARNYAISLQVKTIHSTTLLIECVRLKIIPPQTAENLLDEMVSNNWHCDIKTYKTIIQAIRQAATAP